MIAPAKNRLLNILLADDGSLNARAAVQFLVDLPHDKESMVTALRGLHRWTRLSMPALRWLLSIPGIF